MSLERNELKQLMLAVAKADKNAPVAYSFGEKQYDYNALNDTLREELKELAGTYSLYRENKNTIFALIEETIDEILPKKVMEQYSMFAEVRTFAQGDRPVFNKKEGRRIIAIGTTSIRTLEANMQEFGTFTPIKKETNRALMLSSLV